jgi:hypothetical protein
VKKYLTYITASAALLLAGPLPSAAQDAPRLTLDLSTPVRGIETVCTGIGSPSRQDPRWTTFPLRIEAVDAAGQFLGDVQLSVTSSGQSLITVRCGGPWLLLRIPPGSYRISGLFEGQRAETTANVPITGQGRAVLRFPNPN